MILAIQSKCLCLSNENTEYLNICPPNIEVEEQRDHLSDPVVLNNETENEEGIGLQRDLDCFDLHQ